MDSESLITKRLHISGLTPSLSPIDLSKRLSTFGTVKSLDGFGLRDGVGQPRKFGYVTIETTAAKLAKCLNLLSGSTWKGAKLKIGEAKPDFAERLKRERESENAAEPPKKRRRRMAGRHAENMSLVTPENVEGRGGWKVTPLGRMMRPVKMRPERPLLLPKVLKVSKSKEAAKKKLSDQGRDEKKRKRREKIPDTRARRRTIDMTRWGSVHLKGMFLDVEVRGRVTGIGEEKIVLDESDESEMDEGEEEGRGAEADVIVVKENKGEGSADLSQPSLSPATETAAPPKPIETTACVPTSEPSGVASLPADHTDINVEKNQSLSLLRSLFAAQDDGEWGGRESVGSDIDEELIKGDEGRGWAGVGGDGSGMDPDFEVVPMDADVSRSMIGESVADLEDGRHEGGEGEVEVGRQETQKGPTIEKRRQATKLKDLFAPREEEAGFSLLGHLDIDLELDDEALLPGSTQANPDTIYPIVPTSTTSLSHIAQPHAHAHAHLALDPKQPLFFPLASSFPTAGSSTFATKARSKDLFDVARESGWNWRDPHVGFWRTRTEEEIKERWEGLKVELTREWKRRCREARKVRRRRDAGIEAEGD